MLIADELELIAGMRCSEGYTPTEPRLCSVTCSPLDQVADGIAEARVLRGSRSHSSSLELILATTTSGTRHFSVVARIGSMSALPASQSDEAQSLSPVKRS